MQLAMRLVLLELLVAEVVLWHGHNRQWLILMLAPQTLLLLQYAGVSFAVFHASSSSFRERGHSFSLSEV